MFGIEINEAYLDKVYDDFSKEQEIQAAGQARRAVSADAGRDDQHTDEQSGDGGGTQPEH